MSIDYEHKPRNMSNSRWRSLSEAERESISERNAAKKREAAEDFESHMLYSQLATDELTWLRDRILQLEQTGHE